MLKLILLSITVLVCTSQTIGTVGGYQSYTDLSSQDFQNVLNYIYSSNPDLSGFQTATVSRQLVNGFNYRVNLQNAAGCTAQVTVYATFQGSYSISAKNVDPCPTTTLNPKTTPISVTPIAVPIRISLPISGGYKVQSNTSGAEFESALAQALSQSNSYYRSDLVLTETQVVAGTNYRFTFRNGNGSLTQVVIYVPIGGIQAQLTDSSGPVIADSSSPITGNPQPALIGGGWSEKTDPVEYLDALKAIVIAYPQVKSYTVSGVELQVVAGRNFRIGLQSNSDKTIKYALFKVFLDLSNQATVTQLEWIDIANYSVSTLQQYYNDSLQQHSELNGATLTSIKNIWQNEAVAFGFTNASKNYRVFIYVNKGKLLNLLY